MKIVEQPLEYSIIWPEAFSLEQLARYKEASLNESRAVLLISDLLPISSWAPYLNKVTTKKHRLLLHWQIENTLVNKTYRLKVLDSYCFLAEKYLLNQTDSLLIQLNIKTTGHNALDYVKYLSDFFYFFDERFNEKYQNIFISSECMQLDLNHLTELIRITSNAKKPLKMAFSPYFWSSRGVDIIKNSLSYRASSGAIFFRDISFDGKTETYPGEGLILNQSAAEILLEKHKQLICFFKPSINFFNKHSKPHKYFEKCETFLANILPK